jgi:hypothetical protein
MRVREPESFITATTYQAARACIAADWSQDNEELVGNALLNVLAEDGVHYERTRENINEAAAVVFCVWDTNAEMSAAHGREMHGNVRFDVTGPFEGPDGPDENPMDNVLWNDDGTATLAPTTLH